MTDEALRAFRGITVLGFDVVRSSYGFFPHFLVEVTEEDVKKKVEALSEYETYRDRYYFNSELTRSIMVRHGALAEVPFAEGFDILRIVGKFEMVKKGGKNEICRTVIRNWSTARRLSVRCSRIFRRKKHQVKPDA